MVGLFVYLDSANAVHWPPLLVLNDLYAQALLTMADDEFFASDRPSAKADAPRNPRCLLPNRADVRGSRGPRRFLQGRRRACGAVSHSLGYVLQRGQRRGVGACIEEGSSGWHIGLMACFVQCHRLCSIYWPLGGSLTIHRLKLALQCQCPPPSLSTSSHTPLQTT